VRVKATASFVFISHMVQMKEGMKAVIESIENNFISHMVQMKAPSKYNTSKLYFDFISHMVQMKGT